MATRSMTRHVWFWTMGLLVSSPPALAVSPNHINQIRLINQDQGTVIEISGEQAPNFTTFKQDVPRRVIVDVAECNLINVPREILGDGRLVQSITTTQYGTSTHGISRVIIQLAREAEYRVSIQGGSLFVHLTEGTGGLLVSAGIPLAPEGRVSSRPLATRQQPVEPRNATTSVESPHDQALAKELHAGQADQEEPEPTLAPIAEEPVPLDEASAPKAVALAPRSVTDAKPIEPERVSSPGPVEVPKAQEPVRIAMVEPRQARPQAVPKAIEPPAPNEPVVAQEEEQPEEATEEAGEESGDEVPPPVAPSPYEAVEEPPPLASPGEEAPEPPPAPAPEPMVQEEAVPPPPPPAQSDVEERVEISGALKNMRMVGFEQTQEASRVFIETNEPVRFHVVEEGENLVVLELENTRIPLRNNRRFLDTQFFDSAVTLITPREIEGVTHSVRIEIQLRNRVPYNSGRQDNKVYVSFQRAQ